MFTVGVQQGQQQAVAQQAAGGNIPPITINDVFAFIDAASPEEYRRIFLEKYTRGFRFEKKKYDFPNHPKGFKTALVAIDTIPNNSILFCVPCSMPHVDQERLDSIRDLPHPARFRKATRKERESENDHWFATADGSNSEYKNMN